MIADKVNQAQNVIIAEIKKTQRGARAGGGGEVKKWYASKIARVIANYAILLNKLNDLMTYAHDCCNFSLIWRVC